MEEYANPLEKENYRILSDIQNKTTLKNIIPDKEYIPKERNVVVLDKEHIPKNKEKQVVVLDNIVGYKKENEYIPKGNTRKIIIDHLEQKENIDTIKDVIELEKKKKRVQHMVEINIHLKPW